MYLKYTGGANGAKAALPGVPAMDMTLEEAVPHGPDVLAASGLYELAEGEKPEHPSVIAERELLATLKD